MLKTKYLLPLILILFLTFTLIGNCVVELDYMEYANDAAAQAAYVSSESVQTGLKYWSKLEAAGDVTSPQVGPAGTVDGSPTYGACKFNNGMDCDASGEAYHFTNTGTIVSGNKGTFECWIKTDYSVTNGEASDANYHWFFGIHAGTHPRIMLLIRPTSGIRLWRTDDSNNHVTLDDNTTDWSAGNLVHIACVWDKDAGFDGTKTMAIYINGAETVSTTSALGTYTDNTAHVTYVGNYWSDELIYPVDGIIDNPKFYSIAKTDFSDREIETGYALQCYSENTIKEQGDYSLKSIARITGALNETLTRTVDPTIDLTDLTQIKYDIRGSRTGSQIKIGIHDSGGTTTEDTANISQANVNQTETWDISGVANANKDVIDSIIITIVNADADNTFYIDNMYGETEEVVTNVMFMFSNF